MIQTTSIPPIGIANQEARNHDALHTNPDSVPGTSADELHGGADAADAHRGDTGYGGVDGDRRTAARAYRDSFCCGCGGCNGHGHTRRDAYLDAEQHCHACADPSAESGAHANCDARRAHGHRDR